MASPGNQHCASCIGTLSFHMGSVGRVPSNFCNSLSCGGQRFITDGRRIATLPGFPGMSRICAVWFRVPAGPAPGRQMSRISRHARY